MIAPRTAIEVEREDEVAGTVEVAKVDATIAVLEAEIAAAREAVREQGRMAARALVAGKTPVAKVRDAIARVAELEAMLAGLAELRIIERYHALEALAVEADKAADGFLAEAEAAKRRADAVLRNEVDLGPEAVHSDIPKLNALRAAESEEMGASTQHGMERQEAARLRRERAELKRAHSALFLAEGVA